MTTFLLFESASGYGLFEATKFDEIGNSVDEMQQSIIDVSRFGKNVKLIAFKPFTSAANALEQINAVSESQVMHARNHLSWDSSIYWVDCNVGCLNDLMGYIMGNARFVARDGCNRTCLEGICMTELPEGLVTETACSLK